MRSLLVPALMLTLMAVPFAGLQAQQTQGTITGSSPVGTGTIKGSVTSSPSLVPIPRMKVQAQDKDKPSSVFSMETGADGKFHFDKIPLGTYELKCLGGLKTTSTVKLFEPGQEEVKNLICMTDPRLGESANNHHLLEALAAAAAAGGIAAIVAGHSTASPSR